MAYSSSILWIFCAGITIQVTLGAIAWDSGCGSTKGCFPNCPGGCEYLVTWTAGVSSIDFTLMVEESDSNAYLAIGFSDDYRMGDDSVVGCLVPNTAIESWYNEGTDSDALSPASTGLSSTSMTMSGGVISCSFTRALTDSNSQFFDLNNDYILMLLVGEVESEDGGHEMGHHYMIPWSSDGKVDFNSHNIIELYKMNSPLVKLHGIMMVLAWMLCCTVGMVIARYNKHMVPDKTLLGTKYWFQLHRGAMIGVVIFGVIGFIPIFVEIMGYCQMTPKSSLAATNAHPVLGIIITVLMFANPIMALFRPGGEHKLRWLFNWAHLGVGVLAMVLAVITSLIGLVMERAVLPTSALIVGCLWLAAIVVLAIIMEAHKWKTHFDSKKVADMNQAEGDADGITIEENIPEPKTLTFPVIMLLVFTTVMFVFSIALLVIIAAS